MAIYDFDYGLQGQVQMEAWSACYGSGLNPQASPFLPRQKAAQEWRALLRRLAATPLPLGREALLWARRLEDAAAAAAIGGQSSRIDWQPRRKSTARQEPAPGLMGNTGGTHAREASVGLAALGPKGGGKRQDAWKCHRRAKARGSFKMRRPQRPRKQLHGGRDP
ncbi:unnamed protein product [Symbiodinium sp. CCMP2456]|nr:unnamed protein product [Symbiodinium sp. CCMP2456]